MKSIKTDHITLGEITIKVELKNIKNIHLNVYPPDGEVRISAPESMTLDRVRVFALSKLGWIKKQQQSFKEQPREAPREFINYESHYFLGERYLLKLIPVKQGFRIEKTTKELLMYAPESASVEKRREILEEWYREQLRKIAGKMITKWEKVMNLEVREYKIRKMRTKWGTCNREAGRIWLNLELARKPMDCIEYIVVHEMVHFLERTHNERFTELMDFYMPLWRSHREELNRLPFRHVEWGY